MRGVAQRVQDEPNGSMGNEGKIRTVIDPIVLFFLFLPFLEPQIFKIEGYEQGDTIYSALKLIAAVIAFLFYLRHKPSKLFLLMLVTQVWIGAATLVNSGSLQRYAGPALSALAVIAITEMAMKNDIYTLIRLIRNTLTVFFVINVASPLLWSLEILEKDVFFLGLDNRWIYFFLPWVSLSFLAAVMKKGKADLFSFAVWGCSFVSLVLVWSVGAVLALAVWPILWALLSNNNVMQYANKHGAKTLFWIAVIVNVVLLSGFTLSEFGQELASSLGKGGTLSGRTYLWAAVFDVLNQSPFFGQGVQSHTFDKNFFIEESGGLTWLSVNHPHNFFLNVAYHGGWVAGILFVACFFYSFFKLDTTKENLLKKPLLCFFGCFLLASTVDTLDFGPMYMFLPLACNSDLLICFRKKEEEPLI